jgi:tyrosinase
MAATRRNILTSDAARKQYTTGVNLLKQEASGRTTADFGVAGPTASVDTYDLFVIWHYQTMMTLTPPGNSASRNAAHRGPIFLPWHRVMLILFERNLQRVLGDTTFGLPYWDWGTDGDLAAPNQKTSKIWATDCMGGQGTPVRTGPFGFKASDPKTFRVRIESNAFGQLRTTNRGLSRSFGTSGAATLPSTGDVQNALPLTPNDMPQWDADADGFRNRLEGWSGGPNGAPWLHNRVHVWVGGDMSPGTSPNDPVFFLNHCNVDRAWESWMQKHGRTYVPSMNAGIQLKGHRIDDPIASPLGSTTTPRDVLDVSSVYVYDVLA